MANSTSWILSKLRFPLKPELGGVSPGHIDGLNWRLTSANTITVDSGAAWCPYETSPRVVVLPSSVVVSVGNGTAYGRTQLWLHSDAGVPTVVGDDAALSDNYYGDAFRHPVNKGWRYLGSLVRNGNGDVFNQSCANNYVAYHLHIAQQPFEIISVTGQVAARAVSLGAAIPASATALSVMATSATSNLRFAASNATTQGNTVSATWFTYTVFAGQAIQMDISIGRDLILQYANDVAGGAVTVRCNGYRFRR